MTKKSKTDELVELVELVERASKVTITDAQREEQRRSFAYGNTNIENEMITRDSIDQAAEEIRRNGNSEA